MDSKYKELLVEAIKRDEPRAFFALLARNLWHKVPPNINTFNWDRYSINAFIRKEINEDTLKRLFKRYVTVYSQKQVIYSSVMMSKAPYAKEFNILNEDMVYWAESNIKSNDPKFEIRTVKNLDHLSPEALVEWYANQ